MPDKPTILLVDDNASDVLLIGVALERSGIQHAFQMVPTGEEAIRYLAGQGEYADRTKYPLPRLVLLDLNLPGKSGFDVLEWITRHASPAAYAVVILTGSDRQQDVVRAHELGARSFLVKPDVFEELVDLVKPLSQYLSAFPLRAPSFKNRREPVKH